MEGQIRLKILSEEIPNEEERPAGFHKLYVCVHLGGFVILTFR